MRLFARKTEDRRAEAANAAQGCGCCAGRRNFLMGFGAAAASLAAPSIGRAQAAKRVVDVHAHLTPPQYIQDLAGTNLLQPPTLAWSIGKHLEDMDAAGVDVTILSVTTPGIWFGDKDKARRMSRYTNDYAAKLASEHPGRFGTFTAIPLPDTEGSLREIEYAMDVLKADGIALWTNYTGKYLGDAAFLPVFEELNRRKAVVYTHPTGSSCCVGMIPGVAEGTVETATETTRTVASLIFGPGGTAFKCPDVKFIWSHSGGTVPFLTSRFAQQTKEKPDPRMPNGPVPVLQKFYYEVAQGNTQMQLAALMKLVPISQVMFGTDYPYRLGIEATDGLKDFAFSEADRRAIDYENAIRVMPGLRG